MRDAYLANNTALKNGTGTVVSDGFDLQHTPRGRFEADLELEVVIPALTITELPNTKTVIVDVYHDVAANFGTEEKLASAVLTVTGATAVNPSLPATKRIRLPRDVKRYVRVKATQNDVADASAKSMVAALVF